MTLKFTILGCGNSSGVPAIGNHWGDCDPNEPKNKRFRCCMAVESQTEFDNTVIMIDTGPDFAHQINRFKFTDIDAIFYTHQHSDHTAGIDDLRYFYFRNHAPDKIKCYGSHDTLNDICTRFDYLFKDSTQNNLYKAVLKAQTFEKNQYGQKQEFKDISYIPFLMDHGTCQSVGYRFGNVSYCVDMKSLDQNALNIIKGSDIWIVDGAGYHNENNPAHAYLEQLYAYNKYIGAKKVYVTCLSIMMDYQSLCDELPPNFYPAYDGLTFS